MTSFCCVCKEGFPVDTEPARWRMGAMRLLAKAPKKIVGRFREWLDDDDGKYLCGNCYFDLTDDEL